MIPRRRFLSLALGVAAGLSSHGPRILLGATFPHFFFGQLKYRGGDWDPNPSFAEPIIEEMELRTSIDGIKERRVITARIPISSSVLSSIWRENMNLILSPLGAGSIEAVSDLWRVPLCRRCHGREGIWIRSGLSGRDQTDLSEIRTEKAPSGSLGLSEFLSYRKLRRKAEDEPLSRGHDHRHWTPVIYSQNDLSGAWARDKFGKWANECVPGGEAQRASAFKLGINIIVYSLTSDYKKDLVHHPFIQKRQNL